VSEPPLQYMAIDGNQTPPYNHADAKVLLIDGPIAVRLCDAPLHDLLLAVERLHRQMIYASIEISKGLADQPESLDGTRG